MITPIDAGEDRSMLLDATRAVIKSQTASYTLIQRRVRVGFAKAHKLLSLLEAAGIIRARGSRWDVVIPKDRLDEAIAALGQSPAASTRGDRP